MIRSEVRNGPEEFSAVVLLAYDNENFHLFLQSHAELSYIDFIGVER